MTEPMTSVRIACPGAQGGVEWIEVPVLWSSPSGALVVHRYRDQETYTVTHCATGHALAHEIEDRTKAEMFAAWLETKAAELGVDLAISDAGEMRRQGEWYRFGELVMKARARISARYAA